MMRGVTSDTHAMTTSAISHGQTVSSLNWRKMSGTVISAIIAENAMVT
jgi:hypothetical protein